MKRLRHAAEIRRLRPLETGRHREKAGQRIQNILGGHLDIVVARDFLNRLAETLGIAPATAASNRH